MAFLSKIVQYRKFVRANGIQVAQGFFFVQGQISQVWPFRCKVPANFIQVSQEAVKAGKLKLEWVTPNIHQEAWDIFEDCADQVFSFVDCTSFVIARHAGIKEVFAFDQHFNTMGFMLRP